MDMIDGRSVKRSDYLEHLAKFEGNFYIKIQDKSLEEIEDEFLKNVEFASYKLTVVDEAGDKVN